MRLAILDELNEHVESIKSRDGFTGFPFDRNGIRLGIAALEDETKEVLEEWRIGRIHHTGYMHPQSRETIRKELKDVIAIALMMYESTYAEWEDQ